MNIRFHYRFMLAVLTGLITLGPHNLWACSMYCPDLDEFKLPLPTEKLNKYSAVFLGTLIEKSERIPEKSCRRKDQPNKDNTWVSCYDLGASMNEHIYTFEINKAWKGVKGKTASLVKATDMACGGMTCGTPNMVLDGHSWEFEFGKRYLIYAYKSEEDKRLYPIWGASRPAKLAQVEMMFLNAATNNVSIPRLIRHLPEIFRNHSSPVTRAEIIKWLRHAPPATSTENRRKFFIEALIRTDENLRNMKKPPVDGKDFEGLPGYQEYFDEDDATILTAIALALGNEEFKGDQDVTHVLTYLLNGAEPSVNIAAAESLKKLEVRDRKTDERIYEVLRYGLNHSNMSIRNSVLSTLALIKSPDARKISITDIKRYLTSDSEESVEKLLEYMNKSQIKSSK